MSDDSNQGGAQASGPVCAMPGYVYDPYTHRCVPRPPGPVVGAPEKKYIWVDKYGPALIRDQFRVCAPGYVYSAASSQCVPSTAPQRKPRIGGA